MRVEASLAIRDEVRLAGVTLDFSADTFLSVENEFIGNVGNESNGSGLTIKAFILTYMAE